MRMKASEVGDRLRQIAGKRDHRHVMPDADHYMLRPGPNFDWLMGNPTAGQPPPSAPEQDLAGRGLQQRGQPASITSDETATSRFWVLTGSERQDQGSDNG